MPLSSHINAVVVADTSQQRLALCDTMRILGLCVVDSMSGEQLMHCIDVPTADLWLVDVDNFDTKIEQKIASQSPKCVLLGFKHAPYMNNHQAYQRWQKHIIRKVGAFLNTPLCMLIKRKEPIKPPPWRYVLLLGASMGGVDAIKLFLDNLLPTLPIAVLVAHHFDGAMIETLPHILTRHNDWRCQVVAMTQPLQSGLCLIAPIAKRIVCDSMGRIILSKEGWVGEYAPNIGELLKNASEVYGSQLVAIIFSGMGNDGSQYAGSLSANHSLFWVQDPSSCTSPSQPQAFIDTGLCQYIGTPEALAKRLTMMVKTVSIDD